MQGHADWSMRKISPSNKRPYFMVQDAVFYGPRCHILDLCTHLLKINLDQTQTKHHASSALISLSDMEKVGCTEKVSQKVKFTEMTISKKLVMLYGIACKLLLMSMQIYFSLISEDLTQNHAWYWLKTCLRLLKTCPRPALTQVWGIVTLLINLTFVGGWVSDFDVFLWQLQQFQ